jgi:hypothetical protein
MHEILYAMHLEGDSVFVDIGSGLGKPNIHAMHAFKIRASIGLELVGHRWHMSVAMLHNLLTRGVQDVDGVFFAHVDADDLTHLNGVTHVYSFNKGMPPYTKLQIAEAVRRSHSVMMFACYEHPGQMQSYGKFMHEFYLEGSVIAIMSGSGQSHKCYIYRRVINDGFPQPLERLVDVMVDMIPHASDKGYIHSDTYTDLVPYRTGGEVYCDWLQKQIDYSSYIKRIRNMIDEQLGDNIN